MKGLMLLLVCLFMAGANAQQADKPKWWEEREERGELYYPHNAHREVMEAEGDPCLRCHPFSPNTIVDETLLEQVNTIANEPLMAICHECHVTARTANSECTLCHTDPAAVKPSDHYPGYVNRHANDALIDPSACSSCHVDVAFCTDCHFRRDAAFGPMHPLGFRTGHGLEARSAPAGCGRCHGVAFCRDCHGQGVR